MNKETYDELISTLLKEPLVQDPVELAIIMLEEIDDEDEEGLSNVLSGLNSTVRKKLGALLIERENKKLELSKPSVQDQVQTAINMLEKIAYEDHEDYGKIITRLKHRGLYPKFDPVDFVASLNYQDRYDLVIFLVKGIVKNNYQKKPSQKDA
jgi:hypothetical protein